MRLIAALLLLVTCWLYTANTRVNLQNGDPHQYLHAAQTLREGQGLRNYAFPADAWPPRTQAVIGAPDAPMTTFPPLYPAILALLSADIQAARIVNTVGLWACLMLLWMLGHDYGVWWGVRTASCVAFVVFMADDQITFETAASETVFFPLLLAYLYALPRIRDSRWLMIAILLSVALPMTRYAGVAFTLVGALYILSQRGIKVAALSSMPPALVCGAWFARNMALTGALSGNSVPGNYTLTTFIQVFQVIAQWCVLVTSLSLLFACLYGILLLSQGRISLSSWRRGLRPLSTIRHPAS